MYVVIVLLLVLLAWILAEMKTSRPDGDLVRVHPYRRALGFILTSPNTSVVYFDAYVNAEPLLSYLEEVNERFEARITHCVVAAINMGLHKNPTMNRFVSGYRMYQRRGRWISFSIKKKKLDKKAKLAAVKMLMHDEDTFEDLCRRINEHIYKERSGRTTAQDREMMVLDKLPRPVFVLLFKLARLLDYYNLLPGFFMKSDAMFTSVFCANLGSVGMDAGYHHLYDWGNAPLFIMVGKVRERPWVVDGELTTRKILHLRFTYDERIDDGMSAGDGIQTAVDVLEDPRRYLGCLSHDGSDTRPMLQNL